MFFGVLWWLLENCFCSCCIFGWKVFPKCINVNVNADIQQQNKTQNTQMYRSDLYSTVTLIFSHLHTGTEALNQTVLQYNSNIKCHNTVILFLFLSPALFVCWFVSLWPSLLPYLFFVIDGLVHCLSGIIMMMGIILLRVMIGLSAVLPP